MARRHRRGPVRDLDDTNYWPDFGGEASDPYRPPGLRAVVEEISSSSESDRSIGLGIDGEPGNALRRYGETDEEIAESLLREYTTADAVVPGEDASPSASTPPRSHTRKAESELTSNADAGSDTSIPVERTMMASPASLHSRPEIEEELALRSARVADDLYD